MGAIADDDLLASPSGVEQTEQRGIERGARSLILRQLTRRLGALPESLRSRIDALSLPQLEDLGEALLDFASLADLETWVSQRS